MNNKENKLQANVQDDIAVMNTQDDLILSDQKEALHALALDEDFVKNLISQSTLKGMQKLFSNRGVILSEEEIDAFIEMVKVASSKRSLPDEFFEDAAAGSAVMNNQGMHHLVQETSTAIYKSSEEKSIFNSVIWL